jgi:hypothetical protein
MSAEQPFTAWWNLQNFFAPNPTARLDQFPLRVQDSIAKQFKDWDQTAFEAKLKHLTAVLARMNNGQGPDLLGACEIENKDVVDDLARALGEKTGRDYQVIHRDSPDFRGIDVVFLYDRGLFASEGEPVSHNIVKRYPTRDIFEATVRIGHGPLQGERLFLLGNHWPSRSGGQYETEPFRIMVGENVSALVEKRLVEDENAKIIVMGDLNDEPFNRSVTDYLLAVREKEPVVRKKPPGIQNRYRDGEHPFKPYLYNPTSRLLTQPDPGTHRYGGLWNMLDQVAISRGLLEGGGLRFHEGSLQIYVDTAPGLPGSTMKKGIESEGAPRGFTRKPDGSFEGYSDHLPLTFTLRGA